jgi:hypothetical protein
MFYLFNSSKFDYHYLFLQLQKYLITHFKVHFYLITHFKVHFYCEVNLLVVSSYFVLQSNFPSIVLCDPSLLES